MTWADKFREARGERTRAEAGEALGGCPVNTIRDWEQGKRIPPAWVQGLILDRLAESDVDHSAIRRQSEVNAVFSKEMSDLQYKIQKKYPNFEVWAMERVEAEMPKIQLQILPKPAIPKPCAANRPSQKPIGF